MDTSTDNVFAALADPTRRALFERLCREGAQTVGVLTTGAGVSQPAVSKHLAVLKRAGLPKVRFHDLRHTFATLALQNGVDVKTVSSMLGHYDAGFTLRTYTHATRQKQDEAAQTMGSFMAQVM